MSQEEQLSQTAKSQPEAGREEFSPGEDVHRAEGVRALEAVRVSWGLSGSPGSSFYHFGCLRGGRRPEEAVGCFLFLMKL